MEQQKTKILIISIALLIIGLIGGWIFVVSNMLNNPETSKNTADIQQKQATGEKSKQNNS
jgi:flagellar basal body-associated protein FliL